ncbi:MAG: hypothetical protein SVR94_00860 [Pseudomonadota bacterium]|nr:hypothetical protein [Pseudomonadota bacterium]
MDRRLVVELGGDWVECVHGVMPVPGRSAELAKRIINANTLK